ncbi:MAG: site-specific integrase [Lachnospiraceae bacterium]|nr:site-specific integrase [Lachnospiraceae bacterium]
MGKDIKGKELGRGISQRKKDGNYAVSVVRSDGTRVFRYFSTLKEAKQWQTDTKYEDSHQIGVVSDTMTVNAWYASWSKQKESLVRPNTIRNYCDRYERNIKPVIGRMRINDVKPIHCQEVLNRMAEEGYAGSTINQTLLTMVTMFWSAFENRVIRYTPVTKSGVKLPKAYKKEIDFLSVEEEKKLIEFSKDLCYYAQFRLILDTGMRTGEVIGLSWDCVDFEKREIRIERSLEYRYSVGEWRSGPPKTKHGYRTIKMTDTVFDILKEIRDGESNVKEWTPEEFRNLVFINRTGYPTKNSTYDTALGKRCEKAGIKKVSMHDLRHTFATRFVEASNNYKYLSVMLGHSSIKITMDLYVHQTEESQALETEKYMSYTKSVGIA